MESSNQKSWLNQSINTATNKVKHICYMLQPLTMVCIDQPSVILHFASTAKQQQYRKTVSLM